MNDFELIRAAERGDIAAFTELYERFHDMAVKAAWRIDRPDCKRVLPTNTPRDGSPSPRPSAADESPTPAASRS